MIYFVQQGRDGPVKIGYTQSGRSVSTRVKSLQTGNPIKLRVVAVIPGGGPLTERKLHRMFKDDRLEGEWFVLTGRLGNLIARLHEEEPTSMLAEIEQEVADKERRPPLRVGRPTKARVLARIQREIDAGELVVRIKEKP